MSRRDGPVLIEVEAEKVASPADAPPVPEDVPPGQAMRRLAILAQPRRRSALGRWFWRLAGALIAFGLAAALWAFVEAMLAANPVLGTAALILLGAFLIVCFGLAIREAAAIARLSRLDALHQQAAAAIADADAEAARSIVARLDALYADREALRWGRARLAERIPEVFDADALLEIAEAELVAPLDAAARAEVAAAARQVAAVTAIVPLAFADVAAAFAANLRMIRRVAEIYGGRGGTVGTWRLTRAVFTHLVATGAVAVGDDLVHSVAGGTMLARVSRRFGEGVVNGALTARVGVAAMEVCRPLPFTAATKPSVRRLVADALTGLFGKDMSGG